MYWNLGLNPINHTWRYQQYAHQASLKKLKLCGLLVVYIGEISREMVGHHAYKNPFVHDLDISINMN